MVRLYIRDNTTGIVHEYGTNPHDSLILMPDGSLHYSNMQSITGTMFPDEGYTFVRDDGSDPREDADCIEIGCEAYLDIGGDYDYTRNPLRNIFKEIEEAENDNRDTVRD